MHFASFNLGENHRGHHGSDEEVVIRSYTNSIKNTESMEKHKQEL